jgi:hypothetical protein
MAGVGGAMGALTVSGDGVGELSGEENGVREETGGEKTGVADPVSMGTVSKTGADIGGEGLISGTAPGVGEVQIRLMIYNKIHIGLSP